MCVYISIPVLGVAMRGCVSVSEWVERVRERETASTCTGSRVTCRPLM